MRHRPVRLLLNLYPPPFPLDFARIGLGICYDVRFPELTMIAARQGTSHCCNASGYESLTGIGCHMCIYPSAFNMTTGPLHWELLQRARSVLCRGRLLLLADSVLAARWTIKFSFRWSALHGIWTQLTMRCVIFVESPIRALLKMNALW